MPTLNRCKGTFTTVGTGTIAFAAAVGHVDLAAIAVGATFSYFAGSDTEWEIATGTKIDATSFSRSAVEQGTNGAALVNFSAGTKTFFAAQSAAELNAMITAAGVATLTNKRVQPRTVHINAGTTPAISAAPSINTDNADRVVMSDITVDISSLTSGLTGTATHGECIVYEFLAATTKAIFWGTAYVSGGSINLPVSMQAGTRLRVYLERDAVLAKWVCTGVS